MEMTAHDEWGGNPTEFFKTTTHRAAKQYKCDDCGQAILVDTRYYAVAMKYDGEFKYFRSHSPNGECDNNGYDDPLADIEDWEDTSGRN